MFISRDKLMEAASKGIISDEQADLLIDFFMGKNDEPAQKFSLEKVLYYAGSLIVLGAMTYYMHDLVNTGTFGIILLLSIVYSLIFLFSANFMWKNNNKTPAGLLYTLFILSVSYIVLVITKMTGIYPPFSKAALYDNFYVSSKPALSIIFFLTFVCSCITIKKRPLSFLMLSVIFSLYSLFGLFVPDWFDKLPFVEHEGGFYYSFIFSIILLPAAFAKDKPSEVDYSKWLYISGGILNYISFMMLIMVSFDGHGHEYVNGIIMLLFSFLYLVVSILVKRKVFLFFGGLGFFSYLVYLETMILSDLKANSLLTITFVILTGLFVVFSGIFYKNNLDKIETFVEKLLPESIKNKLPKNR